MCQSLILASASPRRRELLNRIGIATTVIPANVDESVRQGEAAVPYALRVATDKAQAIATRNPDRWVLAADTIVEQGGKVLGKPSNADEAKAMLLALRGCAHRVTTAMALERVGVGAVQASRSVTTEVKMRSFSDTEMRAYVLAGEWKGKAGGYAVQGMAAAFVTEIRGSISNVIGLPLAEVVMLLEEFSVARPSYPPEQAC